jgi:FkbM family methyltransferase
MRHLIEGTEGLILDVGANSGISALGFRAIGLPYRILSIEANRYHEPALARVKKRIAGFDYKILGAGQTESHITLYTPVYHGIPIHTMSSGNPDFPKQNVARDFSERIQRAMRYEEQRVLVVPLDSLNVAPSIIKLDVEGFDYQVMLGLTRTIEAHRPHLFLEYTPGEMKGAVEFLTERDYRLFTYSVADDKFEPFMGEGATARWKESALQVNLFCVPAEKCGPLPLA